MVDFSIPSVYLRIYFFNSVFEEDNGNKQTIDSYFKENLEDFKIKGETKKK